MPGCGFRFRLAHRGDRGDGTGGAANIFRSEIAGAADPDALRRQKVQEYTEKFANPYIAAANGYIDAVISPGETREYIVHAMELASRKLETLLLKARHTPVLIMTKLTDPKTLVIDDTVYETKHTVKFARRKPYAPADVRQVVAFIPGVIQDVMVHALTRRCAGASRWWSWKP